MTHLITNLITTAEFVKNLTDDDIKIRIFGATDAVEDRMNYIFWFVKLTKVYASFMLQKPTLSMFVPCNEDGNRLINPIDDIHKWKTYTEKERNIICDNYEQAESNVLFKNFILTDNENWIYYTLQNFRVKIYESSTLEELLIKMKHSFAFELTDNAIDLIFNH